MSKKTWEEMKGFLRKGKKVLVEFFSKDEILNMGVFTFLGLILLYIFGTKLVCQFNEYLQHMESIRCALEQVDLRLGKLEENLVKIGKNLKELEEVKEDFKKIETALEKAKDERMVYALYELILRLVTWEKK